MKTNSRMSEEAVPNPGGGGTSEVRSRAELEVGESEHCLAQGQAWCLDFISRISIDCHDHSEVEKTTALTPPRPFREERYWVGWGASGKTLGNTHPGSRYWVYGKDRY